MPDIRHRTNPINLARCLEQCRTEATRVASDKEKKIISTIITPKHHVVLRERLFKTSSDKYEAQQNKRGIFNCPTSGN